MSSLLRRAASLLATTALATGSLAVFAVAAHAAPTMTVDPDPVAYGQTLTISGTECVSADTTDAEVNLTVDGDTIVIVPDAAGNWAIALPITDAIAPGTYDVTATCDLYLESFDYPADTVTVVNPNPATVVVAPKTLTVSQISDEENGAVVTAANFTPDTATTTAVTAPDGTVFELSPSTTDALGALQFNVFYTGGEPLLGVYTVTVTDAEGLTASDTFTVIPDPVVITPQGNVLANTGVDVPSAMTLGVALLAAGGLALTLGTRRRTNAS